MLKPHTRRVVIGGLKPLRQRHELIQTQRKRFSSRCLGYENYLTLNKRDTTISYIQSGQHLLWTRPYLLRSTVFHSWVRMPLNGPRILSHIVCASLHS